MRKPFLCSSIRTLILLSFCFALVCSIVATANAAIVQWDSGNGANMHYYQWVAVESGTTWSEAETAVALLEGGSWHLATITSSEEQTFIESLVPSTVTGNYKAWIGGEQTGSPATPSDGWTWVTGEDWDWTNWGARTGTYAQNEPNDWDPDNPTPIVENGNEDYLSMWRISKGTYVGTDGEWLDHNNDPTFYEFTFSGDVAYIAEAVPIPGAVWLLGSGLIGIVGIRRKFKI